MAMLIEGNWSEKDHIIIDGSFVRETSVHNKDIEQPIIDAISEQPGRFHLKWLVIILTV